jgi:hypothetical protein
MKDRLSPTRRSPLATHGRTIQGHSRRSRAFSLHPETGPACGLVWSVLIRGDHL